MSPPVGFLKFVDSVIFSLLIGYSGVVGLACIALVFLFITKNIKRRKKKIYIPIYSILRTYLVWLHYPYLSSLLFAQSNLCKISGATI